jgi:hypothetical protein
VHSIAIGETQPGHFEIETARLIEDSTAPFTVVISYIEVEGDPLVSKYSVNTIRKSEVGDEAVVERFPEEPE